MMLDRTTIATLPLYLDVETRSVVDLRKRGLHLYAENPLTDVWCACYAFGPGPIETWLPGQPVPAAIVSHVAAGGWVWSHNAAFERMIWQHVLAPRYGWPLVPYRSWQCTMARVYAMALPGSLDSAANAVGLDISKDKEGYALMLRMAKPRRLRDDGSPVWWDEDPKRLAALVRYCQQDVEVERQVHARVNDLRAQEYQIWLLDQIINDRGIRIDRELCEVARGLVENELLKLNDEIRQASGNAISTCASVAQITAFCKAQGVEKVESIAADAVEELLARDNLPAAVRKVLELRALASLSSVKKIDALLEGACADGRVRGLLQYHAASTGRWAGRRFQPQNLKRPVNHDQDTLIKLVRRGSAAAIEMVAGSVLEVVSDILRGMIVAAPGQQLFAADFSNIEGRVLAWLAGEDWKIKAFEAFDQGKGPDLYKLAYARAFHMPVENVTKEQRQVGKVMELALGYQGGVGAFQTMAYNYEVKVSDKRADELKEGWREAHPKIVAFWHQVEACAIRAINTPGEIIACGKLSFLKAGSSLYMRLPGGRALCYPYPRVLPVPTPWGDHKLSVTYKSQVNPSNARKVIKDESNTKNWARVSAYGGLLVENATQAVARDAMAEAMLRVEAAGYPIILTVHDEVVAERAGGDVAEFQRLMETRPGWCLDLPVVAKAWTADRYRKD
jgi:DNA polymerase